MNKYLILTTFLLLNTSIVMSQKYETQEYEIVDEIDKMKSLDINKLKILLANKATTMLHGEKAARNSEIAAKDVFSGNLLNLFDVINL